MVLGGLHREYRLEKEAAQCRTWLLRMSGETASRQTVANKRLTGGAGASTDCVGIGNGLRIGSPRGTLLRNGFRERTSKRVWMVTTASRLRPTTAIGSPSLARRSQFCASLRVHPLLRAIRAETLPILKERS